MNQSPKTDDYSQVLDLFREARKSLDISQQELARRMGVQQSEISKCETGGRRLTFLELFRLVDALGIPYPLFSEEMYRVIKARDAVVRKDARGKKKHSASRSARKHR